MKFEYELFLKIQEELSKEERSKDCIHVSDLLVGIYKDTPTQEMFNRGKLYHYAIESILLKYYPTSIVEKEFRTTVENKEVCFTPDAIIPYTKDEELTLALIEIKSSQKSYDYALIQTSIYRYLLQTLNIIVDECYLITPEVKVKQLPCSSELGEREIRNRLKQNLFNFI